MFVLCLALRRRNWQTSWYCWGSLTLFDWTGAYRGMNRREKRTRKVKERKGRKEQIFSLSMISPRLCECFLFYLPHTLVLLQPQNGSMCVKQPIQREKWGEGMGGWSGEREKQMSCDANSKKGPICFTAVLQHILGWASLAACRQALSHIRPVRCFTLCHSVINTGCCTFKPLPALSCRAGCKQMQFCISCGLDTTEAELHQCLLVVCGGN